MEEHNKKKKNVFEEIMAENLPNMRKETYIQVQKTQRVPNKMNPNRPTQRHIIMKMANFKDKENSKGSKEKTKSQLQGNSHKALI